VSKWRRLRFRSMATMRNEFRVSLFPISRLGQGRHLSEGGGKNMRSELGRRRAPGAPAGEKRWPSYQSGTGSCHL
jgi:hypothetical protein